MTIYLIVLTSFVIFLIHNWFTTSRLVSHIQENCNPYENFQKLVSRQSISILYIYFFLFVSLHSCLQD